MRIDDTAKWAALFLNFAAIPFSRLWMLWFMFWIGLAARRAEPQCRQ
jgi:hypothetical protein